MAYPSTSGMVQASSSLHGSMRRDPEGYDMSSDLDQALLLYFDGQQAKTSVQVQEQQPRKLVFCRKKVRYIIYSDKCLVTFHNTPVYIYAEGITYMTLPNKIILGAKINVLANLSAVYNKCSDMTDRFKFAAFSKSANQIMVFSTVSSFSNPLS